jgi:hypothetical protein
LPEVQKSSGNARRNLYFEWIKLHFTIVAKMPENYILSAGLEYWLALCMTYGLVVKDA